MRKILTTAVAVALVSATTYADLQNVKLGGSIRIRGNSYFAGDTGAASQFTEQRTTLKWSADFTDDVSTVIELDNYGIWGTDTRDGVGTASPTISATGSSPVQLYQGYINLAEAWGTALDIKVGRQEIQLGSEFLIGNNDTAGLYTGLSFDGVVAAYNSDNFSITGIVVKLAENDAFNAAANNLDTDLYGLYFSYTGIEDMTIDAYWLLVNAVTPAVAGDSTGFGSDLHTLGARIAGMLGQFDYEAEAALQTGDSTAGTDFDGIALNTEAGYTFDSDLNARLFAGVTFLEGGSADGSDGAFNRLFSDWEYSEFLGNADLTNVLIIRLGAGIQATEKINLSLVITDFSLDEDLGGEDHVGTEIGLYADYAYSDDVTIEAGYAHFLFDSDFTTADDLDYVYAEINIAF